MRPPPSEAVERFRRDFGAANRRAGRAKLNDSVEIALAVSGGPDSMAMLILANAAFPGRVAAATFDHRLRSGSAEEARMVGEACSALGVSHDVLDPMVGIAGSSIQMRAREARYPALTCWARERGLSTLLTGHHADDQAETLLMRLNRSSGIAGLSAIRVARIDDGVLIMRPLLDWRRRDLRAVAEHSGVAFVEDPSNADSRHDRTRIRALLAERPELDAGALAASASFLGDAEQALDFSARQHWDLLWQDPSHGLAFDDLPRELRRRMMRWAIAATRTAYAVAQPAFSDSSNVESLLDGLEAGRGGIQGGVQVRPSATGWTFRPAPPRRDT